MTKSDWGEVIRDNIRATNQLSAIVTDVNTCSESLNQIDCAYETDSMDQCGCTLAGNRMSILAGMDSRSAECLAGYPRVMVCVVRDSNPLQLPHRIQWQLRLVTTTALLLGVLWQNGSWTIALSRMHLNPIQLQRIQLYGARVFWVGVHCCCCGFNVPKNKTVRGWSSFGTVSCFCCVLSLLRHFSTKVSMFQFIGQTPLSVGYLS